jgi:hypothetical protein
MQAMKAALEVSERLHEASAQWRPFSKLFLPQTDFEGA